VNCHHLQGMKFKWLGLVLRRPIETVAFSGSCPPRPEDGFLMTPLAYQSGSVNRI